MAKRCFIILGMHRSGMSYFAKILSQHKVYFGEKSDITESYERTDIHSLHQQLLQQNGGQWYNPPKVVKWSNAMKHKRDNIIKKMSTHELWSFADPKTVFTLDGWLEALKDYKIIAIIRNPIPVAKLLVEEHDFSVNFCIDLWRKYNDKIAELDKIYGPFSAISFSSPKFTDNVKQLLQQIGLKSS